LLAIYKISFILIIGLTLLYVFQGYYPGFMSFFSNAFSSVIAGAAFISSGFSLDKYWHKAKERFSMAWLCFTCGLFLWFVGEALWTGYTLVLGIEIPYPSLADVFLLSGYVPFFVALYLYVEIFGSVLSRRTLSISLAMSVILAIFVSGALIVPVMGTEADLTTMVVDIAYPILGIALLSVAILGLLIFLKGNLGKSWALINAAVLLNTWGYVLFSYTTSRGTYYSGHPIDLLYAVAYVFFLLAFYVHVKEL